MPEPLLALLAIVGILAPVGLALWALARSSQRSLEELQGGGKPAPAGEPRDSDQGPTEPEPDEADEGPDPEGAVPLLEAWFAWIDLPTLEDLQRGDPRPSPRDARAWALASPTSALPLLVRALEALGLEPPARPTRDDHLFIPAAKVGEAGRLYAQALARRADLAAALDRLAAEGGGKSPGLEGLEAALRGAPPAGDSPALDVAWLLRTLEQRCAAAPAGESLLLLVRPASCRELIRLIQGAPPPEKPPARAWTLELQLARGRVTDQGHEGGPDPSKLREAVHAVTTSVFFPSTRQSLFLLAGSLGRAGLLFPLAEASRNGMLFLIPASEVLQAQAALSAANEGQRELFVKTLLEVEREDLKKNPGTPSQEAAVRAALEADRLPREAGGAVEAAGALKTLLAATREAIRHGDDLVLLHRRCDLSAE